MRHATSVYNQYNDDIIDCELSEDGIKQASELTGHYDLVITSTLKRSIQTLEYSQITYNEKLLLDMVREHKTDICDFLEGEPIIKETKEELKERIDLFRDFINYLALKYQSILIISHADFIWHLTSKEIEDELFGKWLNNCEYLFLS